MKILLTTDWFTPAVNGVVTSVLNLRRGLESRGHQVRVLTLSRSASSYAQDGVYYLRSMGVGAVYPKARLGVPLQKKLLKELLAWGPALFLILQAVQVVVPILPGGISCLAGVLIFGPWLGFLLNYLGICAGSMMAFLIARHFGRPVLGCLFQKEQLARYDQWMQSHKHLSRWLAIAIFFPVSPDDFLCYLAGTTTLSWRTFTAIIWLCKPFSIALYSMFLMFGWTSLLSWLHLGGT